MSRPKSLPKIHLRLTPDDGGPSYIACGRRAALASTTDIWEFDCGGCGNVFRAAVLLLRRAPQ